MDSQNPFFLDILQDKEQGFKSLMSTPHLDMNVHQSPPQVEMGQSAPPLQKTQLLREVNGETASPLKKTLR